MEDIPVVASSVERRREFRWPWIIYYAAALHLTWAVILVVSPDPIRTATMSAIVDYVGLGREALAAAALVLAAVVAIWGAAARSVFTQALALAPQQFILMISAISAIVLAISGHYADGVVRPPLFIFADQAPAILIAIVHTRVLVAHVLSHRVVT